MSFLKNRYIQTFFIFFAASSGFLVGSCFHERGTASRESAYKPLEKFAKVLQFVEDSYIEEAPPHKLIENAIQGMLAELDPHSSYLPPKIYAEMRNETEGKFGGIGIEVSIEDGKIMVIAPIDDTPAAKAGLLKGDKIVAIDGTSAIGITLPEAVSRMKGKPGTFVSIKIQREGETTPLEYKLERQIIRITSVKHTILPGNILYVRISSFMERSSADLAKILKENKEQTQGIILDLRSNPGGLLDESIKIANLFFDEGAIVYTIARDKEKKEISSALKGKKLTDEPLVVLIDQASASASEIVAGALQDHKRAVIAGQRSFGKGSVQTVMPVGDGSGLKLTVAKYYTPSGRSIQARGIEPDVALDNFSPEIVAESREKKSIREIDLQGHFDNEADTNPKESIVEDPKEESSLTKRLKSDYMVSQAVGLLKTMSILKHHNFTQKEKKQPKFELDQEAKSKDSSENDEASKSL